MTVMGFIYKKFSISDNNDKNFQYQSDYDNSIIVRQFIFNFINYYLPFFIVALVEQSFLEVFKLMAVKMVVK